MEDSLTLAVLRMTLSRRMVQPGLVHTRTNGKTLSVLFRLRPLRCERPAIEVFRRDSAYIADAYRALLTAACPKSELGRQQTRSDAIARFALPLAVRLIGWKSESRKCGRPCVPT
jgi:hypothetical protein